MTVNGKGFHSESHQRRRRRCQAVGVFKAAAGKAQFKDEGDIWQFAYGENLLLAGKGVIVERIRFNPRECRL